MRYLLLVLLLSTNLLAKKTNEVVAGGYVYHPIHFSEKIPRGLWRPILAFKHTTYSSDTYMSYVGFMGADCIDSPITGAAFSTGFNFEYLDVGSIVGAYKYNRKAWKDANVNIGTILPFLPIIGLELNFKYQITDKLGVKFNNIITPVITNSSMSLIINF